MLPTASRIAFFFAFFLSFPFSFLSQTTITVQFTTDCYGVESSWSISDLNSTVIASAATGTMPNQTIINTDVVLADGCYVFTVMDSYGDGLTSNSCGDGAYAITDSFGNPIVTMTTAAFGFEVVHYFSLPFGSDVGCTDPNATNYYVCANTDDGSCTYPPATADFSFSSPSYCPGSTVQFTDLSVGGIVQWDWTFVAGTPLTSNLQNPAVQFNTAGTFAATLTVTDSNGNVSTISYDVVITAGLMLEVVIVQDNYPNETSWDVTDEMGNVVASGNANSDVICIADTCHTFTIYDSYGDGICCGYGAGSYTLLLDGAEIGTGGQFAYSESVYLNCAPGIDCNNAIIANYGLNTAPSPNSWFTFTTDTMGMFKITTCGLATCDTEIWMYDYCNMANFDNTNQATLTWNDDLCGVQAEITPLLDQFQTYWIRIGDQNLACGTGPLDFEISFLGGVAGCMDPLACNYLPIAVEPAPCFFPGDPECPTIGPDLEVQADVFFNSMYATSQVNNDACYVAEGCMQGFGDRDIIRFTTHIKNIGTEDYFIGAPSGQPGQFEWDACHNHWHYAGYAEYVLYDAQGVEMPQIGFKNGFCVLDLECSGGGQAKYTCGNMGITAGCGDIYSSGLACQWVDVTDIPAGSYTLMIRTNWDQSPDANGSFELSYDNNWAAVCIAFDRDVAGNLINFTKNQNCPIIFDCLGVPFGPAQPDCMNNCPGIVATGDLDNSGLLEAPDVDLYLADILNGTGSVTPCTDLNSDGNINITDVALAAGCIFYGPDHVDATGVQDHCIWDSEFINPNHNVTLSVGNINTTLGYVDIHVLNPDNKIVAYEFDVSGLTIQSVENLVDPLVYDGIPQATVGGNKLACTALADLMVPKNYTPAPLVRIYYASLTDVQVCVSAIHDIVNENYHNTLVTVGPCMSVVGPNFVDFTSDVTNICQGESVNFQDLSTGAVSWSWNFTGGSPASSSAQNPQGITYNSPGVYDVTLTANDGVNTNSATMVAYITVGTATSYYTDVDGDGFGDPNNSLFVCSQPAGYVLDNTDCDDSDATVYPGAPGTGMYVDNNCNGIIEGTEQGPCIGDFNLDNSVDVMDLLEFLAAFGCTSNCGIYDLDGDGSVNSADLLMFLPGYGYSCP